MPRIDPAELISCLAILLNRNGGINSTREVVRIARLMARYSKKLVSKCIYVSVLKSTEPELQDEFLSAGGFELVTDWLTEGVANDNWPLCKEVLILLHNLPISARKLINEGGDMAKKASKCSTLSNLECRSLCTELMKKWGLALTEYLNGDIESASRFLNYSLAELPLPIPVVPSVPESSPEHKSESDEELLPILDFYPKHGNKKGKKKKKKSENEKEKIMDKEEEVFKGTVPILKIVRESGKLATTLKSRARPSSTSAFPEENLESSSLEQLPVVEVDKGLPVVEVDLCKTDTVLQNKAKESRKGKLGQINVFEDEDEKFLRKPVKRKPKNEQEKGKKVQKRTKKEEDSEEEESEEEEEVKPKKRRDKSKKTESKSKKMQKKAEKEEESLDEEEDDSENEDGVKPKKGRGKPKKVGKKPKKIQKKANKEEETSEENESEEDIEETTTKFSAKPIKPVENPKRMKKKITGEERILGEAEKPKKKRVKPKNVDGRSIKMRKKANKGEEKSSEEESDEEEETPKKTMGKPKNPQKRAKRKEETSEEESEEEKPKKGYKKSKKGEDNTKNMLKMTRHEEESSETEGEMSKKDEKGPLKFRKLEIRLFKDSENLTDDQEKSLKDLQQALKAMDKLKKDCEEVKKQPEKSKDEEEKLKKEQEYSKKAEPIPENELVDGSEIDPKDVQKEKEAKEAKKVEDQTEKVNVDKIHEKIECKTDKNSENKVDKKLEEKIDKKLENKTEKKSEEKLDIKSENKTDKKSEEKIDKKMEDKTGKKLEDKTDKKSEAKTDNRSEEKPDKKSEDKTEKKSDNKVDKKSDDIKCEKRVEELRSDKKEAHKKEEIKSKVKDKMIAEKESSKKEKGDSTSKRDDRPAKKEDYRSEKSFSKEKSKSLKEKQSEIDKRTLESLGMLARTNFSSLKIPKKSKPDEVKDESIRKTDKVEEKKLELSKTKDITLERKSAPVKVFNSKFRSHGCEEIAPPAHKKTINKEPLPLKPVLKRPPANGDDIPPIKKLKSPLALLEVEEGKQARPGGIKLINPRPMFTDSSLFMDAISAGAKPEKKRKLKPNESEKEHKKEEVKEEKTSIKLEVSAKEEEKMDTALPPVKPQFKFYKDILEEDEEDNDEKPLAQIKREQEEKMKELEKEKVTVEEPSEEVKKEPEIIEEKEQKEASPPPDLPNIEIGDLPPAPPINFGSVLNKDTGKKGVLVYHRTSKTKKSVRWKAEEDLHEFFVFDLDETERVNVNRLKFQDMKQADKLIEKELAKSCVEERLPWRLIVCDIPEGQLNFVPGMNSEEKIIQSEHEANTLASFYFNKNMIPFSPMEPSPEIRTERSVTSEIPLEEIDPSPDNLYDYSNTGWPAPKTDLVAPEMFLPHHELPGPMPPEHQMPINPAFFPQMGGMPPMAGPSHPRLQGPPGHFGGARPPFPVQNYSNGDTWMTGDGSMFVEPQMGPDMRMPHGMPIHPPDAAHAYRPLRPWRRDPGNWNREPPKRMPSPAPCVHFHARGACRFGNRCFFLH